MALIDQHEDIRIEVGWDRLELFGGILEFVDDCRNEGSFSRKNGREVRATLGAHRLQLAGAERVANLHI
jgi:hypothetical protein